MSRQRGGAVADILIFIGAIVVMAAVAGVACGSCASGASPIRTQSAATVHRYRDCDQRRQNCDSDDDENYRNVSPGPFDRSPVDIHDNEICVSLNCAGYGSTTTTTTRPGERPRSIACLVPAPYHCDRKPGDRR